MKTLKKLSAMMLALVMALGLTTISLAAPETVTNNTAGHSYDAYQIFSGTQKDGEADGALAKVEWGSGVDGTALLGALKALDVEGATPFAACTDAKSVANVLSGEGDKSAVANAFAKTASKHLTGINVAIASEATSVTLDAGYYLIVDTTDVEGTPDGKNLNLLQVTKKGSITIEKKYDVPTVEKKVQDINDSTGAANTDWQDSADWDIGDKVPFQLTGTVSAKYDDYTTYFYQFNDTLSKGLTYDENPEVRVGGANVTDKFDINYSKVGEDTVITIKCDDLKAIPQVTKDSKIVVNYTATLNDNAIIGRPGNPNMVNLEFSNNPNGEGKGKTPDDTVIVFTYKVDVNKIDGEKKPLKGAQFTLYKKMKDGSEKKIGTGIANGEGTTFSFKGLDDGDYVLKETKTPDGYNTIADIEFTVTATHDILSDNPALNSLSGNADTGEITFTGNVAEGSLSTDVVNQQGGTLPETGGIGTTMFYVFGAAFVVGSGVLLVSKKRMSGSAK